MRELSGRSESIFVVTVVFLGVSFITVCLRCFVRLRLVRAFGWDDTLMVAAMALNILFALCGITGSLYGMGQKLGDLEPNDIETAMFWWWLGQLSYVFTCAVAKISIALALLRLTVAKLHKILLWLVIAVTVVVGLVFWFMLTLQCQPVDHFWKRLSTEGHCLKTDYLIDIAYVYSVTACLCDLTLGLLPIALVWTLQMTRKTKIALAFILSLGCIASAAVIVRIPYLHNYKDREFLYATSEISIWSNIEAGLGITAGSLVTLRPLFRWFRGTSYGATHSAKKSGTFPLSSITGNGTFQSKHDRNAPSYWRPDIDRGEHHGVVTTVATSRGSTNSSQENLNPQQNSMTGGVNVHKSFLVTTDQV